MSSGGFGNFGSWTPQQHALNKMVYDEAHKGGSGGGGGNNNGNGSNNLGCLVVVIIVIAVVIAVLWK